MGKELLNFIPNGRDWMDMNSVGKHSYGITQEDEEKKLELRLGPPSDEDCSMDCLGNPKKVPKCGNIGAKRGFLVSTQGKTEAFQQQKLNEFIQQQRLERKKLCGFDRESVVVNRSLQTSTPATPTTQPVVGWPPVRPSFRKNIASTSKAPLQSQNASSDSTAEPEDTKKNLLVKIYMDGIPIGRKVDLKAYDSYDKLCLAVDKLFSGLLAAQAGRLATGIQKTEEKHTIIGLLDGSGEYTLVYEDDEGDRMLAGDVPWNMFVSTAKRLRVLKSSELSSSDLGTVSRKWTRNQC